MAEYPLGPVFAVAARAQTWNGGYTVGDLGRWQAEPATIPVETICEDAALPWGGFAFRNDP